VSAIDAAAQAVIEKAGYGDAYIHGIGHPLGLEVHDVSPDGPLKAGMVVTIEPGLYYPARDLGVRLEDTVVVTETGARSLSTAPLDLELPVRGGISVGAGV
jgi:Xaa-Pro aminopeptidase